MTTKLDIVRNVNAKDPTTVGTYKGGVLKFDGCCVVKGVFNMVENLKEVGTLYNLLK